MAAIQRDDVVQQRLAGRGQRQGFGRVWVVVFRRGGLARLVVFAGGGGREGAAREGGHGFARGEVVGWGEETPAGGEKRERTVREEESRSWEGEEPREGGHALGGGLGKEERGDFAWLKAVVSFADLGKGRGDREEMIVKLRIN